jgi:hypothetical protein
MTENSLNLNSFSAQKLSYILILSIVIGFNLIISAQVYPANINLNFNLSEVIKLDIEPANSPITFDFENPTEAGLPLQEVTENSHWLNYSACLATNTSDQSITASTNINEVYPGLVLTLTASSYTGVGAGALGSPTGLVTLSSIDQVIINGIRGSYTGSGVNNGYQLNYALSVNDYSLLDFELSSNILVTFTITN